MTKDLEINIGKQADPALEREKLESDRRALIERRATAVQLIPSDLEGLLLAPITPLSGGFGAAALLAWLGYPVALLSAVGILTAGGVVAALALTRNSQTARVGLSILSLFLALGITGGLHNDQLKQGMESIGISSHPNGIPDQ